jgi:hypothetical protein
MIALNSECAVLGGGSITAGCGAGSSQEAWLKADLAAHPNVCTIAYWHRPRFSSSTTTPSSTTYNAFWNDLYAAGADVVLNGHAHDYERFAPQTSSGRESEWSDRIRCRQRRRGLPDNGAWYPQFCRS